MKVIVTGAAGFIGHHVTRALLRRGDAVVGIDNLNAYYAPALKQARLDALGPARGFTFLRADVADRDALAAVTAAHGDAEGIVHLAAQAGVRYSTENPYAYVEANVGGQVAVLEAALRLKRLRHVVYASSSSVYGTSARLPFALDDRADRPASVYAATKRAGELLAHSYGHLHGLPTTGLRYFTVYGPWGRPDMAPSLFAEAIMAGRPIRLFNEGRMRRDFTFIDDIVQGTLAALDRPPRPGPDGVPSALYNLGNSRAEELSLLVSLLEHHLGRRAERRLEPMQPGDVEATFAAIEASRRELDFEPRTPLEEGVPAFVAWFRGYHGV